MADDHDLVAIELGEAAAHGPIVAEELVAVQLDEFVEDQVQIVAGHRPVGMPRHLHGLPRSQAAVDLAFQLGQLALVLTDLFQQRVIGSAGRFQFDDLRFELEDRPFECQPLRHACHTGSRTVSK